MVRLILGAALAFSAAAAFAGPPYASDDPEPTDRGRYEIYVFTEGSTVRNGWNGSAGVDFNYGAARDLQLTAVVPSSWSVPNNGPSEAGLGNIELAAKYKFLHQSDAGVDVAFFPRVFLPAPHGPGDHHASFMLPLWLQHAWERWTVFGGGGCEINRGGDSKDFCKVGGVVTTQLTAKLQLGAEIFHQTADTGGGNASTVASLGAIYDLNEHLHLMASAGSGVQDAAETGQASWYAALLVTF